MKMKSSILDKLIVIALLISIAKSFIFKSPNVVCTDYTINTVTTYTITLFRNTDPSLAPNTLWNTQYVPAGSNISVVFPSQYILRGNETCISLSISFIAVQ